MAVAPTALLLRPVPGFDHQLSFTNVSTAAFARSWSFHGSSAVFAHHRRPHSFMPASSRSLPVGEFVEDEEQSPPLPPESSSDGAIPLEKKSPVADEDQAPWLKESRPNERNFHPAPWQQGPPSHSAIGTPFEEGALDETSPGNGDKQEQRPPAEAEKSAMLQIVEKLRRIQKGILPADDSTAGGQSRNGPVGNVVPKSTQQAGEGSNARQNQPFPTGFIPSQMISSSRTDLNISTPQTNMPAPDAASDGLSSKFPWEQDEKQETRKQELMIKNDGKPRVPTKADLTLPREELIRLRLLGLQLDERLKIGKLGVTKSIVKFMKDQFRSSELVKVRCEGPAAASLKKTALELEEKTGGLAVLRTGKIIVMYRGSNHNIGGKRLENASHVEIESLNSRESHVDVQAETPLPDIVDADGMGSKLSELQETADALQTPKDAVSLPFLSNDAYGTMDPEQDAAAEVESFLDELGPRFEAWAGPLPCPVDADLLSQVVPNYRPPFRLLPHGMKPSMTDSELTNLRRLARPLAPHFALGRNRGHQGLAAAMVKLWEKSEVAKVAVKRRVQNTNNLIMSEELKRLTGGVLLARDKFFITFYRGKDFVPESVANALVDRESTVRNFQELEEKARDERNIPVKWTPYAKPSIAVIGEDPQPVTPSWSHTMDVKEQERLKKEVFKLQRTTLACDLEKKLGIASKKKQKAEKELNKINEFLSPINKPIDVETITEEERFMFKKLGLMMKAYLLIGRRGVFDGVVENMHLHWKHRELVKIVVKEVNAVEVQDIARTLEYESGGILVSVSPSRKGQAIIMYRGKNYQRPLELRPRNLLTKRKALQKSLELQRHEGLSKHIKSLQEQILSIHGELRKLGKIDEAEEDNELSSDQVFDKRTSIGTKIDSLELSEEDGAAFDIGKNNGILASDAEIEGDTFQEQIKQLEELVRAGPLFRAGPLSNSERLELRKESLLSGRAPQFFVGKYNGLEAVARGIRIYFLHHDLVQVVVKARAPDMHIDDVIHQLEELTGGTLISRETNKIILYRGWPKGFRPPVVESVRSITPELLSAMEAEEIWEDGIMGNHRIEGLTDESDDDSDSEEANRYMSDGESDGETDQLATWEDIEEGSDEDPEWDDAEKTEGHW